MPQTIALSSIPSQRFQVVLDDQNCTILLRWMQRILFMDLWVGATTIVRGAICENRCEITQYAGADFRGGLHFYDREADEPPRWDDLYNGRSGRWALVYVPEDEDVPEELEY